MGKNCQVNEFKKLLLSLNRREDVSVPGGYWSALLLLLIADCGVDLALSVVNTQLMNTRSLFKAQRARYSSIHTAQSAEILLPHSGCPMFSVSWYYRHIEALKIALGKCRYWGKTKYYKNMTIKHFSWIQSSDQRMNSLDFLVSPKV